MTFRNRCTGLCIAAALLCAESALAEGVPLGMVVALEHHPDLPLAEEMNPLQYGAPPTVSCRRVDGDSVQELGDGVVLLKYLSEFFGILYVAFGDDQRAAHSDVSSAPTQWEFCFGVGARYDEEGAILPLITPGYFIPPDASS